MNIRYYLKTGVLSLGLRFSIKIKEYGHIDSYETVGEDAKSLKYIIRRSGNDITEKSREEVGSVKDVVGSVKDVVGSVKKNRC